MQYSPKLSAKVERREPIADFSMTEKYGSRLLNTEGNSCLSDLPASHGRGFGPHCHNTERGETVTRNE
jgi:hypothetical protein